MGFHIFKAIKESLLTTQDDIIVRGASAAERLNIAAQRLVGRITGGHITGLTATQIRTLLGIEAGSTADLTGLEIVALLEALAANDRLDHGAGLTGLTGDDHTQYILHSLAAAANDFLVASGANAYVKKTLAETLTILAHTIASHSDTTATGAELETLTDGSETELHSHPADGDGAALTVAETEVFSGTSPTTWTDLALAGTVGAQATLVVIKTYTTATRWIAVRKNGDTDDFSVIGGLYGQGCAAGDLRGGYHHVLIVATDTDGKIEWITESAATYTIDIIAYIK